MIMINSQIVYSFDLLKPSKHARHLPFLSIRFTVSTAAPAGNGGGLLQGETRKSPGGGESGFTSTVTSTPKIVKILHVKLWCYLMIM